MSETIGEVYTPEEAAERLKLHVQTIYRLLRDGEIPARKVGKSWRISGQALEAYLRGDRVGKQPSVEYGSLATDKVSSEELKESEEAWRDYLAGIDRGKTIDEFWQELEEDDE